MTCSKIYKSSLSLLTDFYQLTMSYGYWKAGLDQYESVFHLFFRKSPFNGGFTVAAGLESVMEYLEQYRFDQSDIDYLKTLVGSDEKPMFDKDFLKYLSNLTFSCDIDAVPEGTIVFPYQPILRIQGPLLQCQLLESLLLNQINFSTLIATKAARICIAAEGDSVIEFGLRRSQGIDGSLTAARSAFIGGCDSSSNVFAGKIFNIPIKGTHSHSWVMVFDNELESFQVYAKNLPSNCVFLVDTYNSLEGVKNAIRVGNWLKDNGKQLLGIRLDSGDLAYLSIEARKMLDRAGFHETKIVASNELDENVISELKKQGAKIDIWGVGTNLVTAKDQPALDGVYKLSAVRAPGEKWKYRLKLSEQMRKISDPGILQIRRFQDTSGQYIADAVYDIKSILDNEIVIVDPLDATRQKVLDNLQTYQDLLIPIFRSGDRVYESPPLIEIQKFTQSNLNRFHMGIKRFLNPHQYVAGMEKTLYQKKITLIENIRKELRKRSL